MWNRVCDAWRNVSTTTPESVSKPMPGRVVAFITYSKVLVPLIPPRNRFINSEHPTSIQKLYK